MQEIILRNVSSSGALTGTVSVTAISNNPVANAVQEVALENTIGGTFTLAFDGQVTGPLAFDSTAAQIQAALEGLSTI